MKTGYGGQMDAKWDLKAVEEYAKEHPGIFMYRVDGVWDAKELYEYAKDHPGLFSCLTGV